MTIRAVARVELHKPASWNRCALAVLMVTLSCLAPAAQDAKPVPDVAALQAAADTGDSLSMLLLGYAYSSGDGVAKDEARAAELFESAVDAGASAALVPLGFALANGVGVPQDRDRALALFTKALEDGQEGAGGGLVMLGYAIQSGDDGDMSPDPKRAFEIFQMAADNGVDAALLPLAFAYASGDVVAKDSERASELLLTALKAGVKGAGGALVGVTYGLQSDHPERAAQLFQAAVDADVPEALAPLAYAYMAGNGVPQDNERASDLLVKAVKAKMEGAGGALVGLAFGKQANGDAEGAAELFQFAVDEDVTAALTPLGFAYLSGQGVPKDPDRALALFTQAADAGVDGAGSGLLVLGYGLQSGKPSAADAERAVGLFKAALEAGENGALLPLGYAYQSGKGVRVNLALAEDYFLRGVIAGQKGAGIGLRYANENAYVEVMQQQLIERGFLKGVPTGRADRRTIDAFLTFCRQHDIEAACRTGPLDPVAIEPFVAAMSKDAEAVPSTNG